MTVCKTNLGQMKRKQRKRYNQDEVIQLLLYREGNGVKCVLCTKYNIVTKGNQDFNIYSGWEILFAQIALQE